MLSNLCYSAINYQVCYRVHLVCRMYVIVIELHSTSI